MIKIFNSRKGFSLVELLIVITIIGILSTIVLSSLSNSRSKAYDTKVKEQLSSFRTSAEIYFTNQSPTSYAPVVNSCTNGIFADLQDVNASPGLYLTVANLPPNTQVVCSASDSAYAVKATLYSGNAYWCVDSLGTSKSIIGAIGAPVTACP